MEKFNPKEIEKALNQFFKKHDLGHKITVEVVKKWIWNATGDGREALHEYQRKYFRILPPFDDIDDINKGVQIFMAAWNTFPHKELGGKSPNQIIKQKMEKMPKDKQKQKGVPKIIVGGREMEFDKFEAMLKEMNKAQEPFKKWIEKDALPKYKKYLEQLFKGKHTRENHYWVADIFFQRVLYVGFIDLNSIRLEFILEEFPQWWPTHVLSSNLKPAQVKKSLMELFKFIDLVYSS